VIRLAILKSTDVTHDYVNWYSSKEVIKYSDNQYRSFSLNYQISYVENCLKNEDLELYGIFDKKKHIGNISLSGLKSYHPIGEICYVIGDTSYWGKGIASEAVNLILEIASSKHSLHKVVAGVSSRNIASQKVLIKTGFTLEGIRKEHLLYNNEWHDQHDYGLILKK
tara:strand:+ start:3276 stop:3776 length:501 start_codon:yes stop_codon:yes gene_type:complete